MKTLRKGFTLVEIMIVVVLIALLAAIAIPTFSKIRENSDFARFHNDISKFRDAIYLYNFEFGENPVDSSTGELHPQMFPYIKEDDFVNGTPIGGEWDIEAGEDALVELGVGVVFGSDPFPTAGINEFEEKSDNSDVDTGEYRLIADGRYYYVITE